MRRPSIALLLVLVVACEEGIRVDTDGRGASGGHPGAGGGGGASICSWSSGPGAPLSLDFDPVPASELPVTFAGEVMVVEHERSSSATGRLVFEHDAGSRTTLRYTVPSPDVAPAVEAGARVGLDYSITYWAFQLATGVVLRSGGAAVWSASIDTRLDAGVQLRAACRSRTEAVCRGPGFQDVDALVSTGGAEVLARAGEPVEPPGGGIFVLAWWWDTCGCCADPPYSQAWVHAAGPAAP